MGCDATLAAESAPRYDAQPAGPPSLEEALAGLATAVDTLADVDLSDESDRGLLDGIVALERLAARLASVQLGVLEAAERSRAYSADAAVTMASWYRAAARLDHGTAARRVRAAIRLQRLPRLAAALAAGDLTLAHVEAVTTAAVPNRIDAIAAAEPALAGLAAQASPREVKAAVRFLADQVDADGTDAPPLPDDGPDPRRHLHLWPTVDGLWEIQGLLDQLDAEALRTALHACDHPDPADTPPEQRRSPAQRRADALGRLARAALDNGRLPTTGGHKPHILAIVDLATLAGCDDQATRSPRLAWTGPITPHRARRLARDARITALTTMGPWRAVNLGRTQRSLPAWLRPALDALHGRCRGPDCDRPIAWTQAHHQTAWADGGHTDLNTTIPLCKRHHDLVTSGHWTVTHNHDTGTCTWTNRRDGTSRTTRPPPR